MRKPGGPASHRRPGPATAITTSMEDLAVTLWRRFGGYTPAANSTPDDYLAMAGTLGVERSVIVTGSANADNGVTLDAIAASPGRIRGVALAAADITDDELRRHHDGALISKHEERT